MYHIAGYARVYCAGALYCANQCTMEFFHPGGGKDVRSMYGTKCGNYNARVRPFFAYDRNVSGENSFPGSG